MSVSFTTFAVVKPHELFEAVLLSRTMIGPNITGLVPTYRKTR